MWCFYAVGLFDDYIGGDSRCGFELGTCGASQNSRRFLYNLSAVEMLGRMLTACAGGYSVPKSPSFEQFGALGLGLAVTGDALQTFGFLQCAEHCACIYHLSLGLPSMLCDVSSWGNC